MLIVANRLQPLNEELLKAGYDDGGDLKRRCAQVKSQLDDLLTMLENRKQMLAIALNFFRAAGMVSML